MPAIAREVVRPFNPQNLTLPSRISAWFAPFDANNTQGQYFELGDVEDIELNITENFVEKKSARLGIYSTVRRMVGENAGEINLSMTELVGRNLEIMFRSATIVDRNDTAANSATVYEAARVRLSGTTAEAYAPVAVEGVTGGALSNRATTIIEVTNLNGSVQYVSGTDYTPTAAVAGTHSTVAITVSGVTYGGTDTLVLPNPETGGTITLTATSNFEASLGTTGELAAALAEAVNAYAGTYFHATVAGSVVTINANALDGVDPDDITATGNLDTDLGGGSFSFASAVATSAATIERIGTGAIPDGGQVRIVYSFTREACDYSLQDGIALQGALRVQILSNNGPQGFYEFYNVSIALNGAITVNPQEFMKAGITCTILDDGIGRRGRFVLFKDFRDFYVSPQGSCV